MVSIHLKNGSRNINDLPHIYCPRTAIMDCNEQEVDALITEDSTVLVREMRKTLGYQKVCCCLVL
jgi:hypothetical protein